MLSPKINTTEIRDANGEVLRQLGPKAIEELPLLDLKNILDIDTEAYHGPTKFQIFREVQKQGVFPYHDELAMYEKHNWSSTSENGVRTGWTTSYLPGEQNPIDEEITAFVNNHPYPHEINPNESEEEYWAGIERYQERVHYELKSHLLDAIYLSNSRPEYGEAIFPLAFNGAKPVGHILTEELEVPSEQLLTAQLKRIPLRNGNLAIAAGGIKLPQAVHEGRPVFMINADDCQASWATVKMNREILNLAGAKVEGQYFTAVVGTKHPIRETLNQAKVPTFVAISALCTDLASNAYLLKPDGRMMVGDMGMILNMKRPGCDLPHTNWGKCYPAHQQYQ